MPFMKEERNRYDRHSEFIPESQQDRLHRSRILLAGCGAGSPIAAYLARLGFGTKGKITLADPDQVGWENLSRQDYTENDIGLNKALALGNRINGINRQVQVNCIREGITDRNVRALVKQSDVVIDMIDIGAPKYSFLLHDVARESRRPVVLGLDIGEAAILAYVFDYRNPKAMAMRRLLGIGDNLRIEELEKIPMLGFVGQYLLGPCVRIFDDSHEAYDYYFRLVSDGGECILNCLS
jgi:molybdopterin/thiamine biosynthesis adenylyltransferase